MIEAESWKPIPFADRYEVSSYGNLRKHVNKNHPERHQINYFVHEVTRNGYLRFNIKKQHYLVHRLVYLMFVGPLEEGKVVCHIDGNAKNNHFSNLLQATQKENISHKREHGTWQSGEKHPCAKMTNLQAIAIKRLLAECLRNERGGLATGQAKLIAENVGVQRSLVYSLSRKRSGFHNV
jgi:HNH endonuclease/NUMOD4 motif